MSIHKALSFVKEVGKDNTLRSSCYSFTNKTELLEHLDFNEVEFEDAINMNLVKCQTYEEAEEFQQIKMWFSIL